MELSQLIEALSDPAAYAHLAESVEVRHTHISVVFLAGPYAYKIKKPVNFGFLDYSTVELRRGDFVRNPMPVFTSTSDFDTSSPFTYPLSFVFFQSMKRLVRVLFSTQRTKTYLSLSLASTARDS